MFGFYLALQLGGIALCTGALSFSKKPENPMYEKKGNDAVFKWEYSTDNKTAELQSINWSVLNTTAGYQFLLAEDANGNVVLHPNIPSAYVGRVEKQDQATLVIKNINFKDSTTFKCTINGKTVPNIQSEIELVVTGAASVPDRVQFAEIGASVTCTCDATGVPSQYFKWKRRGQAKEITNDAKHVISSSGAGSSQLTIKNISVTDSGFYVCEASVSVNQSSSALCYVQVPSLEQDDTCCPKRSYTVGVGKQVTICCPVSGFPPPFVTWTKNGVLLQEGEIKTYNITTEKEENFGNYSCTATDGKSTIGPFDSSVTKMADLPGTSTDGTVAEAAKLGWKKQDNAKFYVVEISGEDILDDFVCLVGTQTSLEFHYNTLQMKKPGERPKETRICANVTAMNEAGVVGKTPTCQYITIKSDTGT